MNSFVSACVLVILLADGAALPTLAAGSQDTKPRETRAVKMASTPKPLTPLVVAGFRADGEPLAYGRGSVQDGEPLAYGRSSVQDGEPLAYGRSSVQDGEPLAYGRGSVQDGEPLAYGRSSVQDGEPLAYGRGSVQELDGRDAWIPTAIEETLAWRLRRVPALTVVPTVRTHQARRELAESEQEPPAEWSRVVRLLGAKLWLTGTCAGRPDALDLNLELIRVGDPHAEPVQVRLGPGRLFEVIDEATRWTLGQMGVTRIDKPTDDLIFTPPAASPSALEYYAKALSAARNDNLRDGVYYIQRAVECDPGSCPALLLLARIELRASAAARARAGVHLRQVKQLAAERGDALTEAEFELTQGLLLMMTRSFDAARQRFESALAGAFARDDLYGQIAAINSLCDLWLSYEPRARGELPAEAQRRFDEQKLRRAAEWQRLVLQMLRQLGDVIAEVPAANKLALIYERLDESESALEMHKRTVAAAQKTGSARNEATGWLFLGQCYQRRQRWPEALEATTRCLALATDQAKPTVRITLAEIYRSMSLPQEALGQYEAACEALADGDDLTNQFRCLRAAAELRMELGDRGAAIEKLAEALDIAHVLGLADEEVIRTQLEQWRSKGP